MPAFDDGRGQAMNLAEAKARVSVFDLWIRFGFEGDPSKPCRCPFHEDASPSFSVRADGALWNCFAGCGGGDAVDFFQQATGLPRGEACRQFISLADNNCPLVSSVSRPPRCRDDEAHKAEIRNRWPNFEPAGEEEDTYLRLLSRLAELRNVSRTGALLMAERGLLRFGPWKELPGWIVTDGNRCNAQARRIDGQLWPGIEAKAQTLPGSRAAWPLGTRESEPFPVVLVCEGGPDLLAAHHFIDSQARRPDCAAVGILGASNFIPADALPSFAGKRVRIMAHADEKGREAALRWAGQLDAVGAHVDAADFGGLTKTDGTPVKDLNDCTQIRDTDAHQLADLIPIP